MYIKQKKNDNEVGQDICEDIIMVLAENKYRSLVRVRRVWNAPSKEQKEILALTAMPETLYKRSIPKETKKVTKSMNERKCHPTTLKIPSRRKARV